MKIKKSLLTNVIKRILLEENERVTFRIYKDNAGYKFKVSSDLKIFLIGKNNLTYEEPQEFTGEQKIKVAKNLIKNEVSSGRRVTTNSILFKIVNQKPEKSAEEEVMTRYRQATGREEPEDFDPASIDYSETPVGQKEDELIRFLALNSNFISEALNIQESDIPFLINLTIAILGRETYYGSYPGWRDQDEIERVLSYAREKIGFDVVIPDFFPGSGEGIRSYSVGVGQIKLDDAFEDEDEKYLDLIKVDSSLDLKDDLKSMLSVFGLVAKLYQLAQSSGFSKNRPGHIRGAISSEHAKRSFRSTGNAAADIAIVGYNAGKDKIRSYEGKEKNYIPCFGKGCSIESGVDKNFTTYNYIQSVSRNLRRNKQRILTKYRQSQEA